jgi:putative Mn2+ efflux pump MntP
METESNKTDVKVGYKTTEFWLSFAAMIVGAALASGAFPTESGAERILGLAATILASLGYTVSRTMVKK